MHLSIQKRLLLYILSITTLFLVGIGIINYWWAERVVVSVSENRATAMSDAAAARIESYLLQKGQIAWTMAQDQNIHQFVSGLESRYQDMSNNENYEKLLTTLKRIVAEDPDINIAYIAIEKTQRVYDSMEYENPPDYQVSSRPWYKAAISAKGLVFSSPYICPVSGKNVVSAAVPFYDEQGNLLGVAAVEILTDKIQNIVSDVHLFESGYSFMLDDQGAVIASPSQSHLQMIRRSISSKNLGVGKEVSKMLNGETGSGKFQTDGIQKYVFYTPINKVGWSLGVVVPQEEIRTALKPLGRISFITVLLSLFIITLIIVGLTSHITKPLEAFTQVMKKVGDGNYSIRARVDGNDEVANLGESLNQMLDKQQHLIEKVISTAYNMGVAGHELAITIGEGRSTIPWVTSEISGIIGKLNIHGMIEQESMENRSKPIRELFEEMILLNYQNRTLLSQLDEIEGVLRKSKGEPALQEKFAMDILEKEIYRAGEQIDNICQLSETIQMDFVDVSDLVDSLNRYIIDILNTFKVINKQITKIATIQFDLLDRANSTSNGLVEWSRSLLELTSRFHISTWYETSESDNPENDV